MKERPILFNGEMVRAILEGRKTQTRRVVKPQPDLPRKHRWSWTLEKDRLTWGRAPWPKSDPINHFVEGEAKCPYGQPGDRLWVRETWQTQELPDGLDGVLYKASLNTANEFRPIENTQEAGYKWLEAHRRDQHWRPSIHMPRWASRITLDITDVRVERVQEISDEGLFAEGWDGPGRAMDVPDVANWFTYLWNSINEKRGFGWTTNPWVWVIEFKKVEQ